MITPFERPAELSVRQQERARETFQHLLEESDLSYEMMPDGIVRLTFIGNSNVYVIPDFTHGIMSTDVDTGIILSEERSDEAWAYASYSCAFHYNHCLLDTAPAGRLVTKPAWNPGERVHYHTSALIGARNLRELVDISLDCASEVRCALKRILEGQSVIDATNSEDDDHDTLMRRLHESMSRRRLACRYDDDPEPINKDASPAELSSKVVDLFPVGPDDAMGALEVRGRSYLVKVTRCRHRRIWVRVQVVEEIEDRELRERVAAEIAHKSIFSTAWGPLSVDPNDGEIAYTTTLTCDLTSEAMDRLLAAAREFLERSGAELDAMVDDADERGSGHGGGDPFDLSSIFGRL